MRDFAYHVVYIYLWHEFLAKSMRRVDFLDVHSCQREIGLHQTRRGHLVDKASEKLIGP